jgi:hypothetical protein
LSYPKLTLRLYESPARLYFQVGVFFAGGGNFIPAEPSRTQRNSWRFSHASFREDLLKTLVEIRFKLERGRIEEND